MAGKIKLIKNSNLTPYFLFFARCLCQLRHSVPRNFGNYLSDYMGARPSISKAGVRKLARRRKMCFPKCLRYAYFKTGFTFVRTAVIRGCDSLHADLRVPAFLGNMFLPY